ncbi:flagellar protein FlaG [Clostridium autoethanogenum]|uniref:Flagellar protein FlaG n=1 Tax=Clostridium autoethanogenum DSM 10061 TaxID=1341692 RepID=A0ABY4TPP3_9CLOT|nr:flagellar protein FlaG [Clostridium autoethanogenum]URS74501.1 flagellar protein FlaG [Clostridium autoethanogenum DSM 10061]
MLEDKATHLKYEVCGKFNDITVQIIDDKTNKVIKEIPPKKIIEMVDKLCELAGVFLDKKV